MTSAGADVGAIDGTGPGHGPAPDVASARTAWIAGTAIAIVAAAVHWMTHRGELLHGLADESLLVPLARTAEHPAAWATGDFWLLHARMVFSFAYSGLLGSVLHKIDDPVTAVRLLALPFHAAFLAGSFRVIEHGAGRRAAWGGTAILALLPAILSTLVAAAAPWPLGAGAGLPRDLVLALLPLLWIARAASVESPVRARRVMLYLALGVLVLLHPLTAIHIIGIFVLLDVWGQRLGVALRRVGVRASLTLVGASMFVAQWIFLRVKVATPGEVPREVMQWRIDGIGATSPSVWMKSMELALWLVAAAFLVGWGRRTAATRTLRIAALVALGLAALSPAFNLAVAGIQFDRLARVAVWFAVVIAAIDLPAAWAARDRRALAAAAVCVAAAIGGRAVVRAATTPDTDRGVLEWVVRRVEVKMGIDDGPKSEIVPNRPRPGDPSLDPVLAGHFRDVCAWARAETPKDALFAVPPEDWGAFRAYAARGVVVTRKEGGFALSFLGGRGNVWLAEYRSMAATYAARDPDRWAAAAEARWFHYVVLDDALFNGIPAPGGLPETPLPPGWQELRRFGPFRVLRTDVR